MRCEACDWLVTVTFTAPFLRRLSPLSHRKSFLTHPRLPHDRCLSQHGQVHSSSRPNFLWLKTHESPKTLPKHVGRRHKCAPPRKARRPTLYMSYMAPSPLNLGLDHIPWEKFLQYITLIKQSFRTFLCVLYVLHLPLPVPLLLLP